MKIFIYSLSGLLLFICSMSVFAAKYTIMGEPVIIEKRGDLYYVPDTYKPTESYYYVTMDGSKRVCFLEKQPSIQLDVISTNVMVAGEQRTWNCYNYDPEYFVVQPK